MPLQPSDLHIIGVMSNPIRYASRANLFRPWLDMVKASGATVHLGEASFGERDYEVTQPDTDNHHQFRCDHELWLKEPLINAVAQRIPLGAKYVMWLDADVEFVRPEWVMETLHQLQSFHVVQCFSHAIDLGPAKETLQAHEGFAYRYRKFGQLPNTKYNPHMHPGYGWAWRREAWDRVGGMVDFAICGAGDHHMATALIGQVKNSTPGGLHPNYLKKLLQWEERAREAIAGNIGYLPGTILHHFHGHKADRKYVDRWEILKRNEYDPEADVTRDSQGMIRLRGNKPRLRDDLQRYFRERNEDAR